MRAGLLEKHNPLPVGRYWVDVIDFDKIAEFDQWLQLREGEVIVERREKYPPSVGGVPIKPPFIIPQFPSSTEYQPPRDWILFKVLTPVTWLAVEFGWPTIAPKSIQTSEDTVKKPNPNDILTEPFDNLPTGIKIGLVGGGVLLAAVIAAYVLRSVR